MRLSRFVEHYWGNAWPGSQFIGGWALNAICDHLQAITEGKIKNLIINVPQGFSISSITASFWPAWEWFDRRNAGATFATVCYSELLACSTISPLEKLMGHLGSSRDLFQRRHLTNSVGGTKSSYGSFAAVCGARFDRMVLDEFNDPHSSPLMLQRDWDVYVHSWQCRMAPAGSTVIAMPRIGDGDMTDRIVSQCNSGSLWGQSGDFDWLMIPMEHDLSRACETSIGWRDPRTEEGQLAWPERFPRPAVNEFRKLYSPISYERRYQQLVVPEKNHKCHDPSADH